MKIGPEITTNDKKAEPFVLSARNAKNATRSPAIQFIQKRVYLIKQSYLSQVILSQIMGNDAPCL